jgi:hypothetical protein
VEVRIVRLSSVFVFASISFASCAAAPAGLIVDEQGGKALAEKSGCKFLSAEEVSFLPQSLERTHVCFPGVLYVDREYAVVFPAEPDAKPAFFDVTVNLPPLRNPNQSLTALDGARVWVIGDLKYDKDCWAGKLKPGEQQICAPANRPVYLSRGTLVIASDVH